MSDLAFMHLNINKFLFWIHNASHFYTHCSFERNLKFYLIMYQMFEFILPSGYCTKISTISVTETFLHKSHLSICSCSQ